MWTLILFYVFNLVDGCVVACSVELFVSSRICFLLWSYCLCVPECQVLCIHENVSCVD